MPRTILEPRFQVEYLSILDSEGSLDAALDPKLPPGDLKSVHRAMGPARGFDERMVRLQRQGRIGTFAPIKGQEASQLGSVVTLRATDWMVPSFRETAAMIWRGWPLEKILLFFAGYVEGGQPAPDQHDLPIAEPVAPQLPHAVGLAYAAQYRGEDAVVMAYFGDGATSEGDCHEALNFAGVWHVPVVFVCQNNQWAISVPLKKQTHSKTIAQKALAYGMPGIQVDGNDVLAVYAAAREAVDRARGRGTDADRVRHLPPWRPHHGRRPHQVPRRGRGEDVGAEGSAHPLHRLYAAEEPPRRRPRAAGRRGDRPGRGALRGDAAARSADDVRPPVRGAAAAPRGAARGARPPAPRGRGARARRAGPDPARHADARPTGDATMSVT